MSQSPSPSSRPSPDARDRTDERRGPSLARPHATRGAVTTSWPTVDTRLGCVPDLSDIAGADASTAAGLARGVLHEWFGLEPATRTHARGGTWTPPLFLFAHLAWHALQRDPEATVLWIGRRVWPYPRTLIRGVTAREVERPAGSPDDETSDTALDSLRLELAPSTDDHLLFSRSLLIDPPDDATRLWAIDAGLRCPTVLAVVADGSRLTMAASRRLQLAAATGSALALLARPPAERSSLSVATTRWSVRRTALAGETAHRLQWRLELLRAKGVQRYRRPASPGSEAPPETSAVGLRTPPDC